MYRKVLTDTTIPVSIYIDTKVSKTGWEVKILRIDRIKLITEMARQDMTQLRLVELSGVSRATISGIQNGRSCSSRSAVKIADALKVPIETLLEN